MSGLRQRVMCSIQDRRDKILNGGVNCIPIPSTLNPFRYDLPGVEQATYYLVSGGAKSSKTKITNFLFLYNSILYAYYHPELVRVKIFHVLLEETAENVMMKFICYLLQDLSGHKIRMDIKTLKSVDDKRIVPKEIIDLINTPQYQDILAFFEEHVVFIPDRNPTGIYNTVKKYAMTHGVEHRKKVEGFDGDVFDYYKPNDPDEYVLCIIDHISLISTERGMDLRESINKLSEYMKIIRNHYGYIPVVVQQQNSETLSLEAYKAVKIRPTQKGCADSQNPPKDCDIFLGITSPYAFELPRYLNYDITQLKAYAKFLELVLGRDGESNAVIGMFFDGATGFYKALPPANDTVMLQKVYNKIKAIESSIKK